MKRKISLFLIFTLAIVGVFSWNLMAKDDEEVSILFTHDMHSHLDVDLVYKDGEVTERGGFAKIKTFKDQIEESYPGTFLLDGGDFAMGTPFQTIFREKASELKGMAEIGFDVTTLGNHEFDYRAKGLAQMLTEATNFESQREELEKSKNNKNKGLKKAENKEDKKSKDSIDKKHENSKEEAAEETPKYKLPIMVASNVDWEASMDDKKLQKDAKELYEAFKTYGGKEYTIIEKKGVKIGVIGLLGEEAIEDAPLAGLKFENYIDCAKRLVKEIKDKEKVDMIVALSHSGTNPEKWEESEDYKLAKEVPELDLIISGHSHTVLEEGKQVGDTLIASCGAYNQNIGHIVLEKKDDRWKAKEYKIVPLDKNIENDEITAKIIEGYKKEIDETFFSKYGLKSDQVIATSDFDFKPIEEIGVEQGEEPLGNLITDAYLYVANQNLKEGERPFDLAVSPSGTIRSSFMAGDITATDIFNTSSLGIGEDEKVGYPLVDVYLTGKELKAMAEVDATVSDKKTAARIYTSGLSYTINRHRLFLNRAVDFSFVDKDGNKVAEVENDKLYRVAGGLYTCQMLSLVKDNSFGLLSVEPKDENGEIITDFNKRIIKDSSGEEIKEWWALNQYMASFDGKVPEYYKSTHNRKVVNDTYNPVELLKQPNNIAIMLLCIVLIPIIIIVGLIVWLVKRRNDRRGFARSIFRDGGRHYKPSKFNRRSSRWNKKRKRW